jgi:acetylornithine deacetylase/succinyl-diaminopimelate desuccinylase-like protein
VNRIARTIIAATSLLPASALSAQTKQVDWPAIARESQTVLGDYLRVNTTNPPGNELLAARFLKQILDREGIEAQILDTIELGSNRANLYARLRGNGTKRAIALVHHMDVVPATPASWSVDPFSGAIKDGYIWGRGAIDMKGTGIAQLMAMIVLKRSGVPLTRDIVFIGNSDEELTSTGGLVFVKNHPDLLKDVEYLITEGADNLIDNGKVVYFAVGVAEKRTFW